MRRDGLACRSPGDPASKYWSACGGTTTVSASSLVFTKSSTSSMNDLSEALAKCLDLQAATMSSTFAVRHPPNGATEPTGKTDDCPNTTRCPSRQTKQMVLMMMQGVVCLLGRGRDEPPCASTASRRSFDGLWFNRMRRNALRLAAAAGCGAVLKHARHKQAWLRGRNGSGKLPDAYP